MIKHKWRPPLRLRPRPSLYLAAFLSLTHGAALVFAFALPVDWHFRAAVAIAVLASLSYEIAAHVLYWLPWALRGAIWGPEGDWALTLVSGKRVPARLSPSSYVTRKLVVLNFRRGNWWPCSLVLASDSLNADLLRRLRVRLRLAGSEPARVPDAPA